MITQQYFHINVSLQTTRHIHIMYTEIRLFKKNCKSIAGLNC